MQISIRDVTKRFGDFTAVEQVKLDIRSGELIALLRSFGRPKDLVRVRLLGA